MTASSSTSNTRGGTVQDPPREGEDKAGETGCDEGLSLLVDSLHIGDGGFTLLRVVSRSVGRERDVSVSTGVSASVGSHNDGDVHSVVEISVLDAALERSSRGVKSSVDFPSNL
jgi:hypothetical protein